VGKGCLAMNYIPNIRSFHLTSNLRPRSSAWYLSCPRPFATTSSARLTSNLENPQPPPQSNPHKAYYQTHGRALFKCLTLAFFTYQMVYWAWLTIESEDHKDQKKREIRGLEGEVRLLQEGRGSHAFESNKKKPSVGTE
jgi:hypothetical protein